MQITSSRLGIVVSAFVVLAPQTSFATLDDLELPFLEQLPVVLSVSRMPVMRQDAPGAVTVIDADLIQATGYRSVGRLLRLVPGMQVGQERGNSDWITYHGLGKDYPNQTQILIDGLSVHTSALPLSILDIERIEVLRGSDFAAYGSNGFLGLINIITRHTDQEDRTTLRLSAGTRGVADVIARTSARFQDGGFRVTLQSLGDDGFKDLDDSLRSNSVNLRTDLRIGDASELELTAGHSEARRGLGYQGTVFNGSGTRDETSRNSFARLKWRHVVSANEEFNLSLQHGRERVVDEWIVTSTPWLSPAITVPVDANSDSSWSSLEFHHRISPVHNVKAVWGGELRRDKLDAPSLFYRLGPQRRTMARLFGNIEWRLSDQLLLNTSALVERFEDSSPRFAPRAFLIMQPSATRSWRLGYSRAYHQPSVFEQRTDARVLAPDGRVLQRRHVPNPDIGAQRIDVLEAGVFGLLRDKGSYDVRLFHERIKGLIRRMPVSVSPVSPDNAHELYPVIAEIIGSSRWENEPDLVRLNGLEYELRTPQWHGAQFIVTHSMVRAQSAQKSVRNSVAPYTASLTWLQDWQGWQGWHSSASLIRRGAMDASTGFLPGYDYVVPAFTQLDASVWRTVRLGQSSAEIRLTGLNLLGRHQEVAHNPLQRLSGSKQVNRAGPTVYATVQFTF